MRASRITAGVLLVLSTFCGSEPNAPAQDAIAAPTYLRRRTGADDWYARGGDRGWQGGYGYGYGYFQPYISPVISGSWYARPHPYHFDYFRGRWDGSFSPVPAAPPCNEEGGQAEPLGDPSMATPGYSN